MVPLFKQPCNNSHSSPGEGGIASSYYGGGGGGVLVDGQGPVRPSVYDGEGYGGGEGYYINVVGLPGAVILDFMSEETTNKTAGRD